MGAVSGMYVCIPESGRIVFYNQEPGVGEQQCENIDGGDNVAVVNHALRRAGLFSQVNTVHLLRQVANTPLIVPAKERSGLREEAVVAWWISEVGPDDIEAVQRDWAAATPEQMARHQVAFDWMLECMETAAESDQDLSRRGVPRQIAELRQAFQQSFDGTTHDPEPREHARAKNKHRAAAAVVRARTRDADQSRLVKRGQRYLAITAILVAVLAGTVSALTGSDAPAYVIVLLPPIGFFTFNVMESLVARSAGDPRWGIQFRKASRTATPLTIYGLVTAAATIVMMSMR